MNYEDKKTRSFSKVKGNMDNSSSIVEGDMDNSFSKVKGNMDNSSSIVEGDMDNSFSIVEGDMNNRCSIVKGDMNNYNCIIGKKLIISENMIDKIEVRSNGDYNKIVNVEIVKRKR